MKYEIQLLVQEVRIRLTVFFLRLFGYIDKDFEPLKCTCGCRELEYCNNDYLGSILLEYDCKCKKCGKTLNHWAYGHWEIWY